MVFRAVIGLMGSSVLLLVLLLTVLVLRLCLSVIILLGPVVFAAPVLILIIAVPVLVTAVFLSLRPWLIIIFCHLDYPFLKIYGCLLCVSKYTQ